MSCGHDARHALDDWRLALAFWCGQVWHDEVLAMGWGTNDLSRDQRAFVRYSQDIAQLAEEVMLLEVPSDQRDGYARAAAFFAGPQAWVADTTPNALRDVKVQRLAAMMNRYHSGPRAEGHHAHRTMLALLRGILGSYPPGVLREETVVKVREQIAMLGDTLAYYERPTRFTRWLARWHQKRRQT